jgi:myo-inositol-1(or 4)-monophosphatase
VKRDVEALLLAATRAAAQAAEFLRGAEGRLGPGQWTEKARADYATELDREAERIASRCLKEAVPEGRVIGEELTPQVATDALVWIVDPLDGTTNFLHRYPCWAVSIAAVERGELLAAVVTHGKSGERYHALKGGGAHQDGRPIRVSRVSEPRHALVGTGFPFKSLDELPRYQRQFAAVTRGAAGIRRAGSAALDLCDVAAGRFDGFWELELSPWDFAAGTLLVREAGGMVTDLDGNPPPLYRPSPIVAGNPAVHSWLLDVLRDADATEP